MLVEQAVTQSSSISSASHDSRGKGGTRMKMDHGKMQEGRGQDTQPVVGNNQAGT